MTQRNGVGLLAVGLTASWLSSCGGGGSDYNREGDAGTYADIEAFFWVLAGGNC